MRMLAILTLAVPDGATALLNDAALAFVALLVAVVVAVLVRKMIRARADAVSFEYAPTMEDLARASTDLAAALKPVPDKVKNKLLVAADEIFANIMRYSGATRWSMSVVLTRHPEGVRLILSDDGKPFDPLAQRDPDTTLSAAEREIGGLGILIVKKTMSPVTYRRHNGKNILTIGKNYGS